MTAAHVLVEHEVTARSAEAAFLGAAINGAPDALAALPALRADDFTEPRHARVFDALRSLRERGVAPAAPLVLAELLRLGHVARWGDGCGVGPFLHDLLQQAAPGPSTPYIAELLREGTARRRVEVCGVRLAQAADSSSLDDVRRLVAEELAAAAEALGRVNS